MIAGTLEIQMAANLVKLQQDMTAAKNMVGGAMKNIESFADNTKRALGAIGVGLSVGYFVNLIKGSIDATDRINDLSKATKLSVEEIAGLNLAAKQSGTNLDSVASGLNRLGQNIGKEGEQFKALGITAKDPLQAFLQLSDIVNSLEDPFQRNAVLMKAMGKSWQEMGPLISEGSEKIRAMIERGKELSGVDKDLAERADEFNDELAALNITLEGTRIRAVGPLLPQLRDIVTAMGEAAKEGGLLLAVWVGLGGAAVTLATELRKLFGLPTTEMEALEQDAKRIEETLSRMSSINTPGAKARIAYEQEQLGIVKARLELLRHEEALRKQGPGAPGAKTDDAAAKAEAAKRAAAFLTDQKAAGSAYSDLLKARAKNELDVTKDVLQHQDQMLSLQHEMNLVGDKEYYSRKLDAARDSAAAEMKVLDALAAEQQASLSKTKTGSAEYYKALKDLEETQAKQAKVTREFGQVAEISYLQAKQAADAYQRSIAGINAQILQMTGQTAAAAKAQFELQNRDLRNKALANGDAAAVASIDRLGQLTVAQAQFNEERERLGDANARLQIQEERVQNAIRTGSLSELESLQQTSNLRKNAIAQQAQIVANMQRIAEEAQNPALKLQAEQAAAALEKLRSESDLLGQKFETIFTTAGGEELANFINKTKTARQAFDDFATSVVQQINRMVSEALTKRLFEALGMGGSSGAGGGGGLFGWLSGLLGGAGGGGGVSAAAIQSAVGIPELGLAMPMAEGGDFLVHKPTLFLAGDAGTERATFTPGGGRDVQPIQVTNIFNVPGNVDRRTQLQIAAAAGEGVQRALGRNG